MAIYQEHWKKRDPITAGWLSQTSHWLANLIPRNGWLDIAYQAERVIFSILPQVKHSVTVDADAVVSLENDEASPAALSVYGTDSTGARGWHPASEMGGITPVTLTAKTNYNTYTGDVYGDGTDAAATESGVTIRILQISASETIPLPLTLPAWKQPWSGVAAWTVDVARFYDD